MNDHILGKGWPSASVRLDMLEEAIAVIRLLWQGGEQSHFGMHQVGSDQDGFFSYYSKEVLPVVKRL